MVKPLSEKQIESNKKMFSKLYDFVFKFHDYSIEGLDKIQKEKNYLFIFNHSLASYDIPLFCGYCYYSLDIYPRPIIDRLIAQIPFFNNLFDMFGSIPGNFEEAKNALQIGESLAIAPGGMKESLRSSGEKYTIRWENRKGFIKLSLLTGTPIILAACPHADDLYDIKKSPLTDFFYKKFKFPLPFAKGRNQWLPFLPKRVKLTHYIEGPFYPPSYTNEEDFTRKTDEFHAFICQQMNALLMRSEKK